MAPPSTPARVVVCTAFVVSAARAQCALNATICQPDPPAAGQPGQQQQEPEGFAQAGRACDSQAGTDYGGNPSYVATSAVAATPASCTGIATAATDLCNATTAESCPPGCSFTASVDAIAVGDEVSCGYADMIVMVLNSDHGPPPPWFTVRPTPSHHTSS